MAELPLNLHRLPCSAQRMLDALQRGERPRTELNEIIRRVRDQAATGDNLRAVEIRGHACPLHTAKLVEEG